MMSMRVAGQALSTALLLIGSTGCITHQTMTSARTLNAGQTEVTASGALDFFFIPQGHLQVRHGVTERVEVGGTVGGTGVGANVKVGLVRPESASTGFNLAVNPTVHAFLDPTNPNAIRRQGAYLPLLFGFRTEGTELTLAPRVGWRREVGVPDATTKNDYSYFYAGTTVGVALRIGGPFTLTPEAGLHVEFASLDGPTSGVIPTLGLGLTWGR